MISLRVDGKVETVERKLDCDKVSLYLVVACSGNDENQY